MNEIAGLAWATAEVMGSRCRRTGPAGGWSRPGHGEVDDHQVSQRHAEQLAANLELDIEKALLIVGEFGNMGPASVPVVLSKAQDLGRVQQGDRIVLAGIGSGLNCTVGEVIW